MFVVSILSVVVREMFSTSAAWQRSLWPRSPRWSFWSGPSLSDSSEQLDSRFVSGPLADSRTQAYYQFTKATVDFIGALFLLILFAPILLAVALLIRCTSKGPVIFRQTRLTSGGRPFTILKFRTMRQDAEATSGAVWASENDSRITPVGAFLRKTRLDELPQLVNVLRGEMSLIGPRPERPEFVDQLKQELPSFDKRHMVKAGITGLAQVEQGYAASTESYRRKLALDLLYVKRCCLLLDLRIALRTILVVITGSGSR